MPAAAHAPLPSLLARGSHNFLMRLHGQRTATSDAFQATLLDVQAILLDAVPAPLHGAHAAQLDAAAGLALGTATGAGRAGIPGRR